MFKRGTHGQTVFSRGLILTFPLNLLCFNLRPFVFVCMQAIRLSLAVKAKWLLILECILASSVMTVVVNLMYDGMRYNNLLEKIIWCEYEFTCEKLSCKSCLFPSTISSPADVHT